MPNSDNRNAIVGNTVGDNPYTFDTIDDMSMVPPLAFLPQLCTSRIYAETKFDVGLGVTLKVVSGHAKYLVFVLNLVVPAVILDIILAPARY